MGNVSKNTYDSNGLLISSTDKNGAVTNYAYKNGLLVEETDSLGNKVAYEYDAAGRKIKSVDALGKVISFEYDNNDNVLSVTDPLNEKVSSTYDAAGNLTSSIDALGNTVLTKSYDELNRVVTTTDAGNNKTTNKYDSLGRVTSVIDAMGNSSKFNYDDLNRLISSMDSLNNINSQTYDAVGDKTSTTDANGNKATYTYDSEGKLISETSGAGKTIKYEYNANGLLAKQTNARGQVTVYSYDDAGKLAGFTDELGSVQYTYDANGNIKSEKSYIKDASPVENNTNMAYGQDNRITAYNGENVTFDADGNMTSGPLNGSTAAYKYDCRNRLISVGNTQYVYDALNNRIAVIENGNKISYVINPNASLSQVLIKKDAAGSETFYVYGLGLISEEDLNGIYRIYHFDSRGNTVALTDKVGNITDRFQYDIYGKLVTCAGTSKTPFLYVGKDGVMTDSNGLYYMRARYYNTDMNRFVNQDVVVGKIQDSQSLNQFAYTTDNPISKIDPMGNFHWDKVGKTIKAVGDIVVGGFTVAGAVGIAGSSGGIGIVPAAAYEDGQTVDVTNDAEYSSSDSSVVSVDDFGKVTALKNGSASVTATYAGKTMTVNIVVGDSNQNKAQVDANKQWTIKFNHVLDSSTVTKQNIKVLDANGQNVNAGITLGSDKKTVIVTPPDGGYKSGQTYYLNISKNLKDVNGKNLKNDTKMKFIIKQ